MKRLFILALALAAGCAESPRPAAAPEARFGKVDGPPATDGWMPKAAGREDSIVLAVEAGVAGDRIASLLEVPDSDCAVIIARGTPTVDDVDLFAYGEDGALLGSDEASDKSPALLVCPPHPRRLYVAARIVAGYGLVALGAERVRVADAERVAAAYGVRYRPGEIARRMSVWPGLDERLEAHRRSLGGAWLDQRRVAIPLDARTPTRLSASIQAERCLDVLVVPSDEVAALDVILLDAEGRIAGRARGGGRDRALVVCSPVPTAVTLEVRPHLGIGLAIVILSESREGTEADIEADAVRLDVFPSGSVGEERKKIGDTLRRAGYPAGRLLASGSVPLGQRTSLTLNLPAGCARLDLVAGAPLRGLSAWLYAPDGALHASADGVHPTLFACGPAARRARLDVEALARSGPFAIEIRPEPGTPKSLADHPLAANRLLARMVARGIIALGRRVGAVSVHTLETSALSQQDLMVAAGRCIDVTAAVGPGGSGLELRLVKKDGLVEIALGRGEHATGARACAVDEHGGGTLELVAELRLTAGSATALVTAHMTDPRAPRGRFGPAR